MSEVIGPTKASTSVSSSLILLRLPSGIPTQISIVKLDSTNYLDWAHSVKLSQWSMRKLRTRLTRKETAKDIWDSVSKAFDRLGDSAKLLAWKLHHLLGGLLLLLALTEIGMVEEEAKGHPEGMTEIDSRCDHCGKSGQTRVVLGASWSYPGMHGEPTSMHGGRKGGARAHTVMLETEDIGCPSIYTTARL
ncbi:hypothetical protein NE237_018350 [Protea cynaroides]|uniref:Uncharacterized protein n=1 Tax=Protea cynaroides TaxID=273540 RepID=A0A9Q0K9W5_9MAGN|nr:hypothetical protein NE237_018350 [Protea cynaroides]